MTFNQFLIIGPAVVCLGWLLFCWYHALKTTDTLSEKIIWSLLVIAAIVVGRFL